MVYQETNLTPEYRQEIQNFVYDWISSEEGKKALMESQQRAGEAIAELEKAMTFTQEDLDNLHRPFTPFINCRRVDA